MSRAKKQNLESYSAEQTQEEAFEKQRVSVSNARETSFPYLNPVAKFRES